MKTRKKILKRIILTLTFGFILMNIVAFFHAYKFTHFATENIVRTENPETLNTFQTAKALFFGVNNPRPINKKKPDKYIDIQLQSNKKIDCWYLKKTPKDRNDTVNGTIIVFHGYSDEKSLMLDKADEFEKLNYDVLLVDFMGSGGSEGNQTTMGFFEAQQVQATYNYLMKNNTKNIYLFGTSMGAVAIMKAVAEDNLKPKGIIIECPFGSMYKTVCTIFNIMDIPAFPMAGLLVFWGGVQNGFWAFGHKPTEYAKKINCPTLLLYGEKDIDVSRQEIDEIYKNIQGKKYLKTYPQAEHENYLTEYRREWVKDINEFLTNK